MEMVCSYRYYHKVLIKISQIAEPTNYYLLILWLVLYPAVLRDYRLDNMRPTNNKYTKKCTSRIALK